MEAPRQGIAPGGGADRTTTVAAVFDDVAIRHPALERRIRDEQGQTRSHVNLVVGADNIRDRDGQRPQWPPVRSCPSSRPCPEASNAGRLAPVPVAEYRCGAGTATMEVRDGEDRG